MPIPAPLLLSFVMAAQAQPALPATQAVQAVASRRLDRTFISPMGEPFRPAGRDDDTLADWFNQADRNHDGQLTLEEMQQDAERFFATLDVGHDGEIDPDDITRYETVVAPEIQSGASYGMAALEEGSGGRRSGGRHRGPHFVVSGDEDGHRGGARFGLLDLPEPVVSADSNFNRGVSLAEFRQAAGQRFVALDVDHQGKLTLAVLENVRPAPAAGTGKKAVRQRPTGDESTGSTPQY